MSNSTIVRQFIADHVDELKAPRIIEHNLCGLENYKPGRHVNNKRFFGIRCKKNTALKTNELKLV